MSLPPSRKRAGRPRDAAVDEAVLRAARERLSQDGYDRMTIDDVARDAGVTRPTVYRRWPTKAQLSLAAVAAVVAETRHEPTGDTRADILDIARSLEAGFADMRYFGLLGTAIIERTERPEILELYRENLVSPRRASVRAVLERGIEVGEVRPDIDADVVVAMLVGSFYAAQLDGRTELTGWAERVTDAVMRLVAPATLLPRRPRADRPASTRRKSYVPGQ